MQLRPEDFASYSALSASSMQRLTSSLPRTFRLQMPQLMVTLATALPKDGPG
jgi:hypothetical protein